METQNFTPHPVDDSTPSTNTTEAPAATSPDDIQQLIAEAEERGYLRGRNENIANLMQAPPDALPDVDSPTDTATSGHILILNNLKPGIWD